MVHIVLDVFLGEEVKEEGLGFVIVKFFLIITIQEFDSMQCFLEAVVKGLRGDVLRFFLTTTHIVKEEVAAAMGRPAEAT